MSEIKKADTRKSTHLLKKYLKEQFGIKTSIRSEFYAGGCSLRVSYDMGADKKEVEKIVDKLQYGHFNGMIDLYEYSDDRTGLVVDGYQLEDFKYVFVSQELPENLKYKLARLISDTFEMQGVPKLKSEEDFETLNFQERVWDAWNWSNLFHRLFSTRNFVTQDEEKINLKSVHWSEKHNGRVYFKYEVDGIEYNTEKFEKHIKVKRQLLTEVVRKKQGEVKAKSKENGKIEIVDYSEKAIAVIGDTKPIKETLKKLGGRFNFRLTCGAGWIFPKTKLEEVEKTLSI